MATVQQSESDSLGANILGAVCAFGLGIWVFTDISALEAGTETTVRVWGPIALLYNNLGFWPAVCLLPALGLFLTYRCISLYSEGTDAA